MVSSPSAPRYDKYGVFDAFTGKLVSAHDSRTATGNPHGHRVRGIKPKAKR